MPNVRNAWVHWSAIAFCGALALLARYELVEPARMGLLCDSGTGPWWCMVRLGIIKSFATFGLGYLCGAAVVLVLLTRNPRSALFAAIVGAIGLALYCQEPAAISFTVGILVLARAHSRREPPTAQRSVV